MLLKKEKLQRKESFCVLEGYSFLELDTSQEENPQPPF